MKSILEQYKDFKLEIDLLSLDFEDENPIKKGDEVTVTDKEHNLILKCKVLKVDKKDYNVFAKLKVLERNNIN